MIYNIILQIYSKFLGYPSLWLANKTQTKSFLPLKVQKYIYWKAQAINNFAKKIGNVAIQNKIFVPKNKLKGIVDVRQSPSGKYMLQVSKYISGPKSWDLTMGEVYNHLGKIAEVRRNYHTFWHTWVENHPDGRDYLLCGRSYMGQTIVDLTNDGKIYDNKPDIFFGSGFCWTSAELSPDKNYLLVRGCYWGGPYTSLIIDFRNPTKFPWPILEKADQAIGDWQADNSIKLSVEKRFRKSDGADLDTIDYNEDLKDNDIETRTVEYQWRPNDNQ